MPPQDGLDEAQRDTRIHAARLWMCVELPSTSRLREIAANNSRHELALIPQPLFAKEKGIWSKYLSLMKGI